MQFSAVVGGAGEGSLGGGPGKPHGLGHADRPPSFPDAVRASPSRTALSWPLRPVHMGGVVAMSWISCTEYPQWTDGHSVALVPELRLQITVH